MGAPRYSVQKKNLLCKHFLSKQLIVICVQDKLPIFFSGKINSYYHIIFQLLIDKWLKRFTMKCWGYSSAIYFWEESNNLHAQDYGCYIYDDKNIWNRWDDPPLMGKISFSSKQIDDQNFGQEKRYSVIEQRPSMPSKK